jgi:hypothetical protein
VGLQRAGAHDPAEALVVAQRLERGVPADGEDLTDQVSLSPSISTETLPSGMTAGPIRRGRCGPVK